MPASLRGPRPRDGHRPLNVFAGLAAGYLIRDSTTPAPSRPIRCRAGVRDPLVIQDGQFRGTGSSCPGERHPWRDLDRRVLRRPHAGQRRGVADPRCRARMYRFHVLDALGRRDHEPRFRPADVARSRAEGSHPRRAGRCPGWCSDRPAGQRAGRLPPGLDQLNTHSSTRPRPRTISSPAPALDRHAGPGGHLGHLARPRKVPDSLPRHSPPAPPRWEPLHHARRVGTQRTSWTLNLNRSSWIKAR